MINISMAASWSPIILTSRGNSSVGSSGRASAAHVDERHRPRSFEIARFQIVESEASRSDQVIGLAIEMAAAGKPPPNGCEPVLPTGNAGLRCAAVLGEEQSAAASEHPARFGEDRGGVGHRAERESHDHRIDARALDRQCLSGAAQKLHRSRRHVRTLLSEAQQLRGGIDAKDTLGLVSVKRQIEPGSDTDIEDTAARGLADALPERQHLLLPHDPVEQARKEPTAVKAHGPSPVVVRRSAVAYPCFAPSTEQYGEARSS